MGESDVMTSRLAALRSAISANNIAGWYIGREDLYQGEEVPAGDERLAYISGFTGSAGFGVVMADCAALFSDGRYTLQMVTQTDQANWMSHTLPDASFEAWLGGLDLPAGWVLGIDSRLVTLEGYRKIEAAVTDADGVLVGFDHNLIDSVWPDRPVLPPAQPWPMPDAITGRSLTEKLASLDDYLATQNCDAILITRVDAVNWLINQRGHDLEFTPVTLCFAFYGRGTGLCLLGDVPRLTPLQTAGFTIKPLDDLAVLLVALGDGQLMFEPSSLPYCLFRVIEAASARQVEKSCQVTVMKSQKTAAELRGFHAAHQRDGVAMVEFLCWLDRRHIEGISECAIGEKLLAFRQQQDGFVAPSFATIAGSGPNGAIVHYRAIAGKDRMLQDDDVLLLDSGAHYRDGTTDITRTIAIGSPPEAAAFAYSHVLKAHINLATALFPAGTTGQQLDVLARAPLWTAQMDFAHGTGHGVGHVLSVHEGPAGISKRGMVPLQAGMILSNEPGFYQTGAWGIRLENLVAVTPVVAGSDATKQGGAFFCFETITLCPFDRRLILPDLLDARERQWINDYHQKVYDRLSASCSPTAKTWLRAATEPI